MKNVNELVFEVKAQGTESIAFFDLFHTINKETIEPKSNSFARQLKGDEAAAYHEGYILLLELVESWNGAGNFHTLFKTSFDNRLKNLIKYIGRDKRKHNTSYELSLSECAKSEMNVGALASPILETLGDSNLITSFDITEEHGQLESLMQLYSVRYPEQAGLIDVMTSFGQGASQSEKPAAYCEYFGVQTYTSVIQKRVSRAREAFKKFLVQNGYELTF